MKKEFKFKEKIDLVKNKIRKVKWRKIRIKLHNYTLKIITGISVFAFMLSICHISTTSLLSFIIALISLLWICLFAFANKDLINKRMCKSC